VERSAIVLAGGSSTRIGEDKGVLELAGKPLLKHVIDAVKNYVGEVIVVTSSQERVRSYSVLAGKGIRFARDEVETKSPLIGAASGFCAAKGGYSLLLPFDTPFVSSEIVSFLFETCTGRVAAIPKWPNGQIEPLHAVYKTTVAKDAAAAAIEEGRLDMRGMIERMRGVRYISTLVLQQLDPELQTFFNVNTRADLRKASALMARQERA
jgi:molybdopterin-guanine dinucleotide biosynthesis protein A